MVPNLVGTKPQVTRRPRQRNINSLIARKVNERMYGKILKPSASRPLFSLQPCNDIIVRDKVKLDNSEIVYTIDKLASNLVKQTGAYTQSGQNTLGCGVEFQIVNICA